MPQKPYHFSMTAIHHSNGWLDNEPILAKLQWNLEGGSCHGKSDHHNPMTRANQITYRTVQQQGYTTKDKEDQNQITSGVQVVRWIHLTPEGHRLSVLRKPSVEL